MFKSNPPKKNITSKNGGCLELVKGHGNIKFQNMQKNTFASYA